MSFWKKVQARQGVLAVLFWAVVLQLPRFFHIGEIAIRQLKIELTFSEWVERMGRWDSAYYADSAGEFVLSRAPFFPFLSLVLRVFHAVFPMLSARQWGMILPNIFALGVAIVLLAAPRAFERQPGQARWAAALLFAFPFSYIYSAGYPESLFVLEFVLAVFFLSRREFLPAALCVGLLAVTRIQGTPAVAAFAVLLLLEKEIPLHRRVAVLACACAPFLSWMVFQWVTWGDPLAFLHALGGSWGRGPSLVGGLKAHLPAPHWRWAWIMLSLWSAWEFWKRELHWKFTALMTLAIVELPLWVSGGGFGRYMTLNLGMFLFLSEKLSARWPWLIALIVYCVLRMGSELSDFVLSPVAISSFI